MYDAARRRQNITGQKPTSPYRRQSGADQNVGDIEARAIFGPDSRGKTPAPRRNRRHFAVDGGRILFNGGDITKMSMNERARVNIEFTFRRSEGWRRGISSDPWVDMDRLLGELDLEELAYRDVNRGFPGGEIKRPGRVQLLAREHL